MSGYNVTHINLFYVRLQDGTDGLILYSSNVKKFYLEGVCRETVVLVSSWCTTVTPDRYWNGT